jgi:hypothetical protein
MSETGRTLPDQVVPPASSSLSRKPVIKCVASEIVLEKNGDTVAASGLEGESMRVPGSLLVARNVLCTACWEVIPYLQDPNKKVLSANLPACALAINLNTTIQQSLANELVADEAQ